MIAIDSYGGWTTTAYYKVTSCNATSTGTYYEDYETDFWARDLFSEWTSILPIPKIVGGPRNWPYWIDAARERLAVWGFKPRTYFVLKVIRFRRMMFSKSGWLPSRCNAKA